MKKKLYLILIMSAMLALAITPLFCVAEQLPQGEVFSEFLSEYSTGQVLKSVNADERHEIASMVKIMTANLIFEAIDRGVLTLESSINVSATAAGMGGSQLFLDANQSYVASDLVKGIIVVSANDASVAMAEAIAGSHEGFVAQMNARAKQL
ncbi:MAG: serine hydrolase, partial [Clostridia bacterium]